MGLGCFRSDLKVGCCILGGILVIFDLDDCIIGFIFIYRKG